LNSGKLGAERRKACNAMVVMTAEKFNVNSGILLFGVSVALAMLTTPVRAHHSFSMFDAKKTITLHGVVKEFLWTNPHVFIQLVATGGEGVAAGEWSIELTSPEHLVRAGWKPGTLKTGDKVTILVHPIRLGSMGGQFVSGLAADGTPIGPAPSAHAPESK
jgi:Family of unknown function (DUF6152)